MNKYKLLIINGLAILIYFLSLMNVMAQDTSELDQGDIQDAQVIIKKDRIISLPQERKLYEFIQWSPPKLVTLVRPNIFQTYEFNPTSELRQFKLARPVKAKKEDTYPSYLKLGYGNFASPIIDLSISTQKDPNKMLGVNFKHESFGSGAVDGGNSASSTNQANLYGIRNFEKLSLSGNFSFQTDKNFFYGYEPIVLPDILGPARHANNFIDFNVTLGDNNQEDRWTYDLSLGAKSYSDNFAAKERTFLLSVNTSFDETFHVDTDIILSKYEDGASFSRSYFRIDPYFSFEWNQLDVDLGVSLSLQNDSPGELSGSRVFPFISARYALNDLASLYAKIDGGFDFNDMYGFASDNPYLNSQVAVSNTEKLVDLTFGINASPGKRLTTSLEVGFQSLRNLPVFVNSLDISKFEVIYDIGNAELFRAKLNGKFLINNQNYLEAGVAFYQYTFETLREAYHMPTLVLGVNGHHGIRQLADKLHINWSFELLNGIKALDQATDTDISLDVIPKLDLSVHYQLKDKWGLFLSGENIIGKEYARFYRYPQRSLQVKCGLTYRF